MGKAGVRLQMQDTIIVWASHYSLVKTPHNGGGDFCIRHKLPDREPFLNDLAKQGGTTVQRPHICNVVKKRGRRGQVIIGRGALLERIQEPVCDQLGTGRLVVGWALNDAADYFFLDGSPPLSLSHYIK